MKKTFFAKHAMRILLLVVFLTPLVLRGARDALRDMKNSVKDWLPSRFSETAEMEWFWNHFAGERFIICTWPGCTGGPEDEAFHLFKKKLTVALPPSKQGVEFPPPEKKDVGATWLQRPYAFIGDTLGLYTVSKDHFNRGGYEEKWLRGFGDKWYYITPSGDLYEFLGSDAPVAVLARGIRNALGLFTLTGTKLQSFGEQDGPWYYADPNRLQAQFFRAVVTGPDVLHDLTDPETGTLKDDPDEAMKRLSGALFGPDGKQTALIVTMTDAGLADFHRVLGRGVLGKERGQLYKVADECGIAVADLKLGGPPVDNVAIDEEGSVTLIRLVTGCVVLGLTLSYLCFRSVLATLAVFTTGGISAALGLCFVGWTPNVSADAIMMSMPALVYVLGISGSVHFINYYREAVDEHGLVGSTERALGHAWKPAVFGNVTTAIGLLSLCTSEIIPIRNFGIFSALGVMATLILMFSFLPATLQMWPLNLPKHQKRTDGEDSWLSGFLSTYWERLGRFIIRNHWAVATGCILFIAVTGYGVTRINTSVNLLELFDPSAKILSDYAWIEDHLGMLVPMEVVVKFSPNTMRPAEEEANVDHDPSPEDRYRLSFLDRIETVGFVQKAIDEHFGTTGSQVVGRSMSALTFLPELPGPTARFSARRAANTALVEHRDDFLKSDYLRIEQKDESELWRVSLRVAAFKGLDYGEFVIDLRNMVEPIVASQNARQHILKTIVEQRAQSPEMSAEKGPVFDVALVIPDTIEHELRERTQRLREAAALRKASRQKIDAEVPESAAVTANEPAKPSSAEADKLADIVDRRAKQAAAVRVTQTDHDMLFVRSLRTALEASNSRVKYVPASSLTGDAAKSLDQYEFVLVVGDTPASISPLMQEHPQTWGSYRQFIGSEAQTAANTAETIRRPVNAVYTGVVPIVYKAQRTLLDSLISSTVWSFLTITPLMMLVSRNVWAGLVAMLPNALPVLVIFGFMGWAGIRVDIGSMMTASIALGVAVDDTIHYLTWFREELERLGDRNAAILAAYKRCATPTTQAAIISGLGLSIFALSTFTPTQRFGYLMLSILFAGVVAELIFYPALLAGPLGAVFKVKKPKQTSDQKSPPESDVDSPTTLPLDSAKARSASKRIASFLQFWA